MSIYDFEKSWKDLSIEKALSQTAVEISDPD